MFRRIDYIVGTLATIGLLLMVVYFSMPPRPMTLTRFTKLFVQETMRVPLERFRFDMKRYPTSAEGLAALIHAPTSADTSRWQGPYVEVVDGKLPCDPWGHDYQYRSPGLKNPRSYDLWSLGPDGVPSDDDIGNWKN